MRTLRSIVWAAVVRVETGLVAVAVREAAIRVEVSDGGIRFALASAARG